MWTRQLDPFQAIAESTKNYMAFDSSLDPALISTRVINSPNFIFLALRK